MAAVVQNFFDSRIRWGIFHAAILTDLPASTYAWDNGIQFRVLGGYWVEVRARAHNGEEWTRLYEANSKVWATEWARTATATPPTIYDLPLAAGVGARNKTWYCKNQFDHVVIHLDISAVFHSSAIVANVPVGYMPAASVSDAAYTFVGGDLSSLGAATFEVSPDGTIRVYYPENDGQFRYFVGTLEFDI